jgi:hypothetical protein
MHPFVTGELACGNLKGRIALLSDVDALPWAAVASDGEALRVYRKLSAMGPGMGLDRALLSSCGLWTLDKRLARAAKELALG